MITSEFILFYLVGCACVVVCASIAYFGSERKIFSLSRRVIIFFIACTSFLFILPLYKFWTLHMYTDVAHWLTVLHGIITTGSPTTLSHALLVPGTENYFSVHFTPFIYLFALVFRVIPRPETVLIMNSLVMLSSAVPLYLLARRMIGGRYVPLVIVAVLFWYPTFQYITLYEFEMLRLIIPIFFWALYFFERQHFGWYALLILLAVLVREEVGLTVALFGVYAWLFRGRRREGVFALLVGIIFFFLITSMIMPALRTDAYAHIAAGVFAPFGDTPLTIMRGVFLHPVLAASVILDPIKLANLFMLVMPLLFLPLVALSAMMPALAAVGIGLISEARVHSSFMLYYVAPAIPFLYYALLRGWPRAVRWLVERRRITDVRHEEVGRHLATALFVAVIVANVFFGPSPLSLQFWSKEFRPAPFRTQDFHHSVYNVTQRHLTIDTLIAKIPKDAIVSTQEFIQPRLYMKRAVMKFPQIESENGKYVASYILLDRTNNQIPDGSPAAIADQDMESISQQDDLWERLVNEDGYELYERIQKSE